MSAPRGCVRGTAWAVSAALLVGPLAACSGSAGTGDTATDPSASSSAATAPSTGGTASSPSARPTGGTEPAGEAEPDDGAEADDGAEPTEAVTDAPVDVEPGSGLDVVVSFAALSPDGSAVEASGFLPGRVEEGGRCVLVLSRAGRPDVTAEVEAFADAQSVACGLLSVPLDRLSPGTWTARLDYRSDVSSGSSDDVQVVVP